MTKKNPGVEENIPAAEEEMDYNFLFEEESGVDDDLPDAEEEEQDGEEIEEDPEEDLEEDLEEEEEFDDKTSKAFAKRLAAKEAQIEARLRDQITRDIQSQQQSSPYQQPQYQQPRQTAPQVSMKEQIDKLADELAMTPEAVQILYQQQLMINQQAQQIQEARQMFQEDRDTTSRSQAKLDIEKQRKINPWLPEFSEGRLSDIRKQYQQQTGVTLPWKDAYKQLIAEEALSGNLNRSVQQDTLKKVSKRNKKSVKVKTSQPVKKTNLDDLTDEEFEKLIQRAKDGDFKKS